MNKTEVAKILSVIKIAFPNSFRNMTKTDLEALVILWERQFTEYQYQDVLNAVDCIISTDTSGFMPTIGKIKEMIVKLNTSEELTEQEAWNLVANAARNGISGATEEFNKLPETVQKILGSPQAIFEYAVMDSNQFQTVAASNFMRSYRARVKHEREMMAIPNSVKLELENKGLLKINGFTEMKRENGMLTFKK